MLLLLLALLWLYCYLVSPYLSVSVKKVKKIFNYKNLSFWRKILVVVLGCPKKFCSHIVHIGPQYCNISFFLRDVYRDISNWNLAFVCVWVWYRRYIIRVLGRDLCFLASYTLGVCMCVCVLLLYMLPHLFHQETKPEQFWNEMWNE